MKTLKKYLFNNHKLNTAFIFILIFSFFILFSFLLLQYETFIYLKYTQLYKNQTMFHLSYDVTQILKSDISDASKLNFLNALSETYLKDANIKEIWVTDNELRLFFSSDSELMAKFHAQKLPAFYYPLYEEKFKMKDGNYLPHINNSLDKYNTYILLPVKIKEASSFDYTMGLKIRKKHFWLQKNPVVLFHTVKWNYSLWILYAVFAVISLLAGLVIASLIRSLYYLIIDNVQTLADKLKNLEEYSDVNTIKLEETDNNLFKSIVLSFNNLVQHILFKKNEECDKQQKSEIESEKKSIVFNVQSTLFPKPVAPLQGFSYDIFQSDKNIQTHYITQIKNIDSFRSSFLVTETKQSETELLLAEYNYLYNAYHNTADIKEACLALNKHILSLSNSQLSGAAGFIDSTNNVLTLYPSGLPSILYYKASTNTVTSDFQKEPMFGILPNEDYEIKLKEEKIKVETDDILVIFNEDILTEQLTLGALKEQLINNANHNPETIINYLSDFVKSKNIENLFLFVLKKK